MDSSYIAIWLPIFILFILIWPNRKAAKAAVVKKVLRRRKGRIVMTNELIKKYLGKDCRVTTGSMGISITGRIIEVNENWVEIETKKGKEIMNLDYIQNITVKG